MPIKTVIAIVLAMLVLVALVSIFLLGLQLSPMDARRIFAEGCAIHCNDIRTAARESNQPIGIAAVKKAHELEGSMFIRACNFLYPETTGYPYLCWIQNCCDFELPPP